MTPQMEPIGCIENCGGTAVYQPDDCIYCKDHGPDPGCDHEGSSIGFYECPKCGARYY